MLAGYCCAIVVRAFQRWLGCAPTGSRHGLDAVPRSACTGSPVVPATVATGAIPSGQPQMITRDVILAKIRNARVNVAVQIRPAHDTGIEPVPPATADLLGQFIELAQAEAATVDQLAALAEVPAAVARYLEDQDIADGVVLGPDPQIRGLGWQAVASLKYSDGPPRADGDTVITGCYAAVADCGAVVVASSSDHPVELNFLPANHIVLLRRDRVLENFEQLWTQLRRDYAGRALPRCINLIVGPSRTADLGVPPILGAHGPGRVHILII